MIFSTKNINTRKNMNSSEIRGRPFVSLIPAIFYKNLFQKEYEQYTYLRSI